MSYPPYGGGPPGGYPPAGGFGGAGGYPPAPGGMSMPTPDSAASAAYNMYGNQTGMPYPAQPGGLGFDANAPQNPGAYPPSSGYPPAAGGGYPPAAGYPPAPGGGYPPAPGVPGGQPGFGGGPGYPPAPAPSYPSAGGAPAYPSAPGYGQPPMGGGYGQPPAGSAPGYGQPPAGSAPGYGQPPAGSAPGYGQPPAGSAQGYGGYGQPQQGSAPGGYGQPQQGSAPGGYGQPGAGGYQGQSSGGNSAGYSSTGPASYHPKEEGTLRICHNFNVEDDVQRLRKAMKGAGTDEKAIIDILGYRSSDQRQNIKMMYKTCFGRDLMQDLKSDLSGRFENALIGLLYRKDEYDCYELRRAMRGAGTDEAAMIEILCSRSNAEIQAINATYKTMYHRKLEEDIISETSGHFKKLLVSMSVGGRLENQAVDQNKARTDADRLYKAGEKRWGTDENTFNMVLASQSFPQLRAVFDEYGRISKKDIDKAIAGEMSGDVARGMRTIVRVVRDKPGYFSERLYHSMKGAGTDDRTLIRVVVTRCEVDMKQIKEDFMKRYGKTLESFVRDDVSGDYKKIMLALIGGIP